MNVSNENNNDDVKNLVVQPNHDIPKTIYNRRLCRKLAQKNTYSENQNQIFKHTENINTVAINKITQDKNEEINNANNNLKDESIQIENNSDTVAVNTIIEDKNEETYNDNNILKEITISLVHDDHKRNPDSTLIICEPDITLSDCELDTTQIIPCKSPNNGKKNVSSKSFFPKLRRPLKLKKKMVISPATIGVQSTLKRARSCTKNLNTSDDSLELVLDCVKSNSPKNKIKSLNKDVQSTLFKDDFTKIPTSKQKLFIPENYKKTQSINVEDQKIQIRKTNKIVKNNNNTEPVKVKKSSNVTCLGPSNDKEFNVSVNDIKCMSMNNEKQSSSPPKQTHQSNLVLPCIDIKHNSSIDSKQISTVDIISEQKSSTSTNNSLVIQSMKIVDLEDTKVKISPQVACNPKYHSNIDNEEMLLTNTMSKQKSSTHKNTNQVPSLQIEVEQIPFRRKKIVIEKSNTTEISSDVRKCTSDACNNPSVDKLNMVTKSVESFSTNNEKVSSSPSQQKQSQSNCILPRMDTKCHYKTDDKQISFADLISKQKLSTSQIKRKRSVIEKENNICTPIRLRKSACNSYFSSSNDNDVNMSTKYVKCASMNNEKESSSPPKQKHSQSKNEPYKYIKCDSTDDKRISTLDIISKQKSSTSENNSNIQSMKIEDLEDIKDKIIKQIEVVGKEYNNKISANVKNPQSVAGLSSSNDNEFNLLICSSKDTEIETFVAEKTGAPSISIEVEQGSIFKHSSARRVILHPSCYKKKEEVKKGRRVQLITIKDHYSKPLPSFNGAKKTEIDVSKKSIHTEKVVESSSCFYIPQIKRRRTMNFGNSDQ